MFKTSVRTWANRKGFTNKKAEIGFSPSIDGVEIFLGDEPKKSIYIERQDNKWAIYISATGEVNDLIVKIDDSGAATATNEMASQVIRIDAPSEPSDTEGTV